MTALAESWDVNQKSEAQANPASGLSTEQANQAGQLAAETQPWLFRANDTGRPKVVPIPILTPRAEPLVPSRRASRPRGARRASSAAQAGQQHRFDFQEARQSANVLDAVIDCDAPVANTQLRVTAAVVDGLWVAGALALFLSIFFIAGGSFGLDRNSVLSVGGAAVVLFLLYHFLWCLGGGDTPGTKSAGLMLINFDGRRPDRTQRLRRLAAGVLSVMSVGLGLIWVLVDEESLAWHDHISKTFPTSR